MKKFKYLYNVSKYSILVWSLIMTLSSCDNEFNDPEALHNRNPQPPVITSVAEARENVSVEQGVLENLYYIKGENLASVKSIKYNGYEAGYNPVYVTDNLIISSIPEEAPVIGSNKLRLETEHGVAEYDFTLLTITGYETGNDGTGDIVIIGGGDFTHLKEVVFFTGSEEDGNLVENIAQVREHDNDQIVAYVPEGTTQAYIRVTTDLGASVVSESYGFNYPIFVDSLNPDWTFDGWSGGTIDDDPALGQYSIRADISGWGGLSINTIDEDKSLGATFKNYTTLVFKVYATAPNQRLVFGVNHSDQGDGIHWDASDNVLQISNPDFGWEPGDWTQIEIPLSKMFAAGTGPQTIYRIYFQIEQGTFYIDDMGFL